MKYASILKSRSIWLALAVFGCVSLASASEISFHMPVAAKWGNRMLPAGDYVFHVDSSSPIARVSGHGIQATVFVTSTTSTGSANHGHLRIVDVSGTPTVAEFSSESEGITYEFALPKSKS